MTFELQRLILEASRELVRPACEFDGHDWISEGGGAARWAPKGAAKPCMCADHAARTTTEKATTAQASATARLCAATA